MPGKRERERDYVRAWNKAHERKRGSRTDRIGSGLGFSSAYKTAEADADVDADAAEIEATTMDQSDPHRQARNAHAHTLTQPNTYKHARTADFVVL